MTTAKEIKKITSEKADVIVTTLLEHLKSEIDKAARAGYSVYRTTNQDFDKELVKLRIQKHFLALGFQVSFELGSFSSGEVLTIKW